MSELELDDGVRALLETDLDSFEKLEIVRVLRAAGQAMAMAELEAACRFSSEAVEDALASLARARVVDHDRKGRLIGLGKSSKDPRFSMLMQLYEQDRVGVLAVLSSVAMQRIRSMAARVFSDAFVLRNKKRGDDG